MINERMYINLLKEDLQNQAQFIPTVLYNEKVFSVIIVSLRSLILSGKTIKMNADIFEVILNMYPDLLKAFDEKYVEKTIVKELKEAINSGKTKSDISQKYAISIDEINYIMEEIKTTDINLYDQINSVLSDNEKQKEINMIKDISNLNQIISSLGPIKNNILTTEQKVKFTYLYGKYIHNSLEDIYNGDYKAKSEIDTSKIHSFFTNILKFHHIFKQTMDPDKVDNIIFNNSWYKDYDRIKFFGMKNGVPTIENKYGKNEELLTLNQEQVIIETLKTENIPLKEFVVKIAFREFFKDNLFEYISKLKSYDQELEEINQKGRK